MNFHAIGDLAQSLTSRRHSASLQSDLTRLTQELSSGQVSDVAQHLNGSFDQLSDIENQIALNDARKSAGAEASFQAATMQAALEQVQSRLTDVSGLTLLVGDVNGGPALDAATSVAREALDAMVSALNSEVAGRPIFAGTSLNNAPLAGGSALMDAARAVVSGATDAASVISAMDAFFGDPGGGFETLIYHGGTDDLSPIRLGAGESVRLSIRADDPALRAAMKVVVMAALAGDDALALNGAERSSLLRQAGGSMHAQIDEVTSLRADLGYAEDRIGQSQSRNAAERTSLQMARGELLSVDRFETASALKDVQFQLEMIYTLTARTSRLNLVNFL